MNVSQAFDLIKTIMAAVTIPVYYPGVDNLLPDDPQPLAFVDFILEPQFIASYGGGPGRNTYRNPARLVVYVLVPRGQGVKIAADHAETIAALFRSYRGTDNFSCFGASVIPGGDGAMLTPPGLSSPVNNYYWAAVEVVLFFDQQG